MSQTLKVVAVSLVAFAVYLPLAYLTGRDFVPQSVPEGEIVERLMIIYPQNRYAYFSQSYGTSSYADLDMDNQKSPIIIYEDMTPLGPAHSQRVDVEDTGRGRYYHSRIDGKDGSLRFFIFSTSDNSDPRTNGRTYWAVLPKD